MKLLVALAAGTATGIALARLRTARHASSEASPPAPPAIPAPEASARVAVDVSGAPADAV